jgi:hypothetical protein
MPIYGWHSGDKLIRSYFASPRAKQAKFVVVLELRWLSFEWTNDFKPCRGLQNPCNAHYHDIFAAATRVNIGDGKKALFWESSWVYGC